MKSSSVNRAVDLERVGRKSKEREKTGTLISKVRYEKWWEEAMEV